MPGRYSVVAVVAAVLALGSTGCNDTVTGTVFDANGLAGRVDAQSNPSGENANGTARFGSPDSSLAPTWELDVTCLSVTDKTAIIGFTGTYATSVGFGEVFPTAGLIRAVDGGAADSEQDSLEFASVEGPQDGAPIPGPTTCSSYPGGYPIQHGPITNHEGDLVITDSPPLPTTKADCARGGWQKSGVFASQAGCESFVARFGS